MIELPGQCNLVNTLDFSIIIFSDGFCLLFCTRPDYTSETSEELKKKKGYS